MSQDFRCGHNHPPMECPFPRCGYREALSAVRAEQDNLDGMSREINRLKTLIDRDKTGLANALNRVRQIIKTTRGGFFFVDVDEHGKREVDERTATYFRNALRQCFDECEKIALEALSASGE